MVNLHTWKTKHVSATSASLKMYYVKCRYPEQYLGHGFLHRLCEGPQVVVQRRVHHAGVHGVNCHRGTASHQLLLQVVGEEDQGQFALGVGTMGTVAFPGDGEGEGMELWLLISDLHQLQAEPRGLITAQSCGSDQAGQEVVISKMNMSDIRSFFSESNPCCCIK